MDARTRLILLDQQQARPVVPPAPGLHFERDTLMPVQQQSWTCSAHALSWLLRALGFPVGPAEAVNLIGYPDQINSNYGLMYGNGQRLVEVLKGEPYHLRAVNFVAGYDQVHQMAAAGCPMIAGGGTVNDLGRPTGYYHWIGIRSGLEDGRLWIANSAPGWTGYVAPPEPIYDFLRPDQWSGLGPWWAIWIQL